MDDMRQASSVITDAELERLLAGAESDRVEFKASPADGDRIRQAICAFANDMPGHGRPGILFIGARDDGSCANLVVTDEVLRTLGDMRLDGNILPIPSMTVQRRTLQGCELAVVVVQPSDTPPVRYRGRVWIRVGPRRAIAGEQEERLLAERRRSRHVPADIRPVYDASPDELDLPLIRDAYLPRAVSPEVLAANERTPEEQLLSLKLTHPAMPPVATVLGLLVAGRNPPRFLPMAYVNFVRFTGPTASDPMVSAHDLRGPLPRLVPQIDELLNVHVMTKVDVTTATTELRQPDYPVPALQQLVRNAIMHRVYEGTNAPVRIYWYSDRVEILSPGGPYGLVTPENFGEPGACDYRNLHLAEAMRVLGYVQRFGVGIPIARDALARNGNPPLEFRVEPHMIMATVRRRPWLSP